MCIRDRGIGAWKSAPLGIPGENLSGVIAALDFLRDFNLGGYVEVPRRAVVVGGGNAAIDAARTLLRLGAEEVNVVYRRTRGEMPAISEEVEEEIQILKKQYGYCLLYTSRCV